MAAAIVPLIAGIAPSIIQLIAGLVHKQAPVQEVTNGPGTGPVKFANVFQQVMEGLENAAAAGQIDKTLPSSDLVKVVIQSVVTALKLPGGILDPASTTGSGILGASVPNLSAASFTVPPAPPLTLPSPSVIWTIVGGSLQVKPS